MKRLKIVYVFTVLAILMSCTQPVYKAPYVISNPECIIGEAEGFFKYAGITMKFYNTSEKEIQSMELTLSLFDPEIKKSPLFGTGYIITKYENPIAPDTNTELSISLDEHLYSIPKEALLIENFCIRIIKYTDGTQWTDYFAVHSVDSKYE